MSLGENSLVAAYQGKDSEKSTIRNEGGDNLSIGDQISALAGIWPLTWQSNTQLLDYCAPQLYGIHINT